MRDLAGKYALWLFVLLVADLSGGFGSASAAETSLRFGGTGGSLGPMRQLSEAFMKVNPDVAIEVLPSLGSGGGIKAVLAGAIDLSFPPGRSRTRNAPPGPRAPLTDARPSSWWARSVSTICR